ncbi:MBL fold metallo-hydrolase [Komagataeibacter xylinus]|uniref:MBL fold metallo-hydrolase n=1 Tax=Komagataeibacter xylinus TaxID=28448 RepID=A0A318PNT3_KOMXY|nr:MBL fold metallo-hydrolase [Komagataeibacter xylinus]AZV38373.1 MBL fold metallo-hydrolase [Komagataeibacter xylinus]PYD58896.1 MBL fold metallo-hydrolase [Komagataeibacter xylinus]GBQ77242.1 hydroxyacylglutathione hydrolase [Komagataeibacter xylinus NBRC 15237]
MLALLANPAPRNGWRVSEPPPPYEVPLPHTPAIRRVVANNPGPMTGNGTNSWLVEHEGGCVVIDPGSATPAHLDALVAAEGERPLTHIILTHTHHDHLDGARPLGQRLGIPVCGFHASEDPDFTPDIGLRDGERIAGLRVLYTPGHASDHICLETPDGIIFTGDHIMGWSTTMIPPAPYGSVRQFLRSMDYVRTRNARLLLPAHGPAITRVEACIDGLVAHRMAREDSIMALLPTRPSTLDEIVDSLYHNLRPALRRAARLNLQAHLEKLLEDGKVRLQENLWARIPPDTACV